MNYSDQGKPSSDLVSLAQRTAIVEQNVTQAEFRRFLREQEAERHGTALPDSRRIGVVALDDGKVFVGCAVAELFAQRNGNLEWAYLAELFIEKPHRGRGLGRALLTAIERRAISAGVRTMRTNTAE